MINNSRYVQTYATPLKSLVKWHGNGELNLNPPYQRPYVWIEWQKEKLIDSVLLRLPINAIYLTENSNSVIRDVIDGKQRLITLFDYINGVFIPKESPSFADLSDGQKAYFLSFPMNCYYPKNFTNGEIVDLYNRLNFNGTPHKESERAVL